MTEATLPKYVAIIADGNRRWASERGMSAGDGYREGAETVRARLRDAAEFGIQEVTIFAFSTENWGRPAEQVRGLMELFAEYIHFVTPELHEEGVRLRFIGNREPPMPDSLVKKMVWSERLTAANELITFFVPINYGGRADIIQAAKRFTGSPGEDFSALLYARDMHDPELVIRPGGEKRLSNFLSWQAVDAWIVFSDEMWPEFSRESFEAAIKSYQDAETRRALQRLSVASTTGR